MVGGDREVFDRVKPVLDAFGDKVFYAGEIGAGSVAKLVHNMIGHSVRQAIAEGLTLGVKAGVDPEPLWECVRRGALGRMSFLHEGLVRTMFRGEFDPASFALNLAHKDISLATELAREYNVPMPMSTLAQQISTDGYEPLVGPMPTAVQPSACRKSRPASRCAPPTSTRSVPVASSPPTLTRSRLISDAKRW